MKFFILTWHFMDNYGGVLQCWALQKVLLSLGYEVEILNFQPSSLQSRVPWWRGWKLKEGFIKNFPLRVMRLFFGKAAERKFDAFREGYLNLSEPYSSLKEVNQAVLSYDAVVVGSDQVWRFPKEKIYFLDFDERFQGKKISYAACCGSEDDGRYKTVANLWKKMDAISVRNRFSKEIVDQSIGVDVPVVVDPTLLVDIDELATPVYGIPEKYIVTYIMGAEIQGGHRKTLDAIKGEVGNYPILAIVATAQCPQFFSFADKRLYDVGPNEWVYLLKNASFIYTDSFHATLYAVKHKKLFLSYYTEPSRSGRFLDLAERYSLSTHIATSADDAIAKVTVSEPVEEVERTNKLVTKHIADSYDFIRTALSGNPKTSEIGIEQV
jgi:hypothetical protein